MPNLLDIPVELRLQVYDELLGDKAGQSRNPAILRTFHEIFNEAMPVLYESLQLKASACDDMPSYGLKHVKELLVTIDIMRSYTSVDVYDEEHWAFIHTAMPKLKKVRMQMVLHMESEKTAKGFKGLGFVKGIVKTGKVEEVDVTVFYGEACKSMFTLQRDESKLPGLKAVMMEFGEGIKAEVQGEAGEVGKKVKVEVEVFESPVARANR